MNWLNLGVKLLPFVVGAVHAVEAIKSNAHGKEKQDAAIDAIGAMVNSVELSVGADVMNQEDFKTLLRHMIDDYVAIQNYISAYNAQHALNSTK